MKLWEYTKILVRPHFKKNEIINYKLYINDLIVENLIVKSHLLHFDTYKLLSKFKKPQYNVAYLMRKKQGFSTVFFKQAYDIIICDRYGNVLKTFINQKSGYISDHFTKGYFIYFMVVGSIKFYDINESDRLTLKREMPSLTLLADVMGLK